MAEPAKHVQKIYDHFKTEEARRSLKELTELGIGGGAAPSDTGTSLKNEKSLAQEIDERLAALDREIGTQLDEVLHLPEFQALESAWRSLDSLVKKCDFKKARLAIVQITKEELRKDFAGRLPHDSNWFEWIYNGGMGQFGGIPVGTVVGNFAFQNTAADIGLLKNLAAVSAMAHAPFIDSVSPDFFGWNDWNELATAGKELPQQIETSNFFTKWRSLRKDENARYLALTLPRVLRRLPYDPDDNPADGLKYYKESHLQHDNYLWGNASFAYAGCMLESFSESGWPSNIIGPQSGGAVKDLPIHRYETTAGFSLKVPTEVKIKNNTELMLSEEGFNALTWRENSDEAVFFSDSTVLKPKQFDDKHTQANFELSTKLTYMSLMNRLTHYLKVEQMEHLGSWKSAQELENYLTNLTKKWINTAANPKAEDRDKYPFKMINVTVVKNLEHVGWYDVTIEATPHLKYMGADFTLTLTDSRENPAESRGG